MTQKNIDFGTFPDDPSADAIRTAFQKAQENFTELYSGVNGSVNSINKTPGAGITVSSPTGNVVISANIAQVQVSTSSLSIGKGANGFSYAAITKSNQVLVIDLPPTISTVNANLSGYVNVDGNVTSGNFSTAGVYYGNGSGLFSLNGANVVGPVPVAGSVSTNAQPNITSVGTLTSLTINDVANLHIPGGTAGDVLSTLSGNGVVHWIPQAGGLGGDKLFVFELGDPDALVTHLHYVTIPSNDATYLIEGTSIEFAVADEFNQPFLVLTSSLNSEPGDLAGDHTHDITVFYDYLLHKFIVAEITNLVTGNHAAYLVGGGGGGGGGGSYTPSLLTTSVTFVNPNPV